MRIETPRQTGTGIYQSVKRTEPQDLPAAVRKWNDTADTVEKLQKEYQQLKFRMVGMELKNRDDRSADSRMRRSAVVRGRYVTGQRKKAGF